MWFELATILGVPRLDPVPGALQKCGGEIEARLARLLNAVHRQRDEVNDDS